MLTSQSSTDVPAASRTTLMSAIQLLIRLHRATRDGWRSLGPGCNRILSVRLGMRFGRRGPWFELLGLTKVYDTRAG